MTDAEIQKADPAVRTRALRFTLGLFLVFFVLVVLFFYNRDRVVATLLENLDYLLANPWLVFLFMLLVMAPVLVMGVYMFLLGNRVIRALRFPPPGEGVVRDMRVLTGRAAVSRGRVCQFTGAVLIVLGLAVAMMFQVSFVRVLG